MGWASKDQSSTLAPPQPPRQEANRSRSTSAPRRSKSRSPGAKRSASRGASKSPQRRLAGANAAKAKLVAELSGIGTPPRITPSPKRKGRRGATPPARRNPPADQGAPAPFNPQPLTPVGWDVDAAQRAATPHPSANAQAAPPAAREASHSPDNPNRVERLRRQQERRNRWRTEASPNKGKGGQKGKPAAIAKVKPGPKGKGKGGKKGNTRYVTLNVNPGKGAKGGGKNKNKR